MCTRVLEFDAGHRVLGHEGKCSHLHGHRYRVEVTASAESLDDVGRVVDFGAVKDVVGRWVDDHLDHGTILSAHDPAVVLLEEIEGAGGVAQKLYLMDGNPTAENLATLLLERSRELLAPRGVDVVRVRVWETPNCYAEAP